MNTPTTEVARIVREAEKVVSDLWNNMQEYEEWRRRAVARRRAIRQAATNDG